MVEIADAATVGVLLTGSHARGDATRYSDVDLLRFVADLPPEEAGRYTLLHRGGWLVSVSTTTIAAKRAELARPETAIWAVPGLRQARILLDPDAALAALHREAMAFEWAPLQDAANAYASYTVMGDAEEVHKILAALARGDESATLYGTLGLVLGLARAVAVQRGLLIQTENAYFRQVQEAVGPGSAWTRYFRLAAGFDASRSAGSAEPARERGLAALGLYRETVTLLRPILRPAHHDVIQATLAAIHECAALS